MGVYKILKKEAASFCQSTKSFWVFTRFSFLRWISNQRTQVNLSMSSDSFPPPPSSSQEAETRGRREGEASVYRLTRSLLLKTIHCFKSSPDAPYFKLLHTLATVCHSFSQSRGFLLVLVSQTLPPQRILPQWARQLLGSLGAFVFCSGYEKSFNNYWKSFARIHNLLKKNPEFPTVHMPLNKQLVYAKNEFLRRTLSICHFKDLVLAGWASKLHLKKQTATSAA